ncbi:MAG TPA: hypothetical protein VEG33_18175 [Streptosporangiaceae bacterium]|nr:hypothetical protein [Streptosporangiaceae bacterium]
MSTVLPHEHEDGKIQGWHRDRLAAVYVRQLLRQQMQAKASQPGCRTGWPTGRSRRAGLLAW